MSELLGRLLVEGIAAAAVIICVMLFLKYLREERKSRDKAQERFLAAIEKLSVPITELTLEVRMLRDQHDKSLP